MPMMRQNKRRDAKAPPTPGTMLVVTPLVFARVFRTLHPERKEFPIPQTLSIGQETVGLDRELRSRAREVTNFVTPVYVLRIGSGPDGCDVWEYATRP